MPYLLMNKIIVFFSSLHKSSLTILIDQFIAHFKVKILRYTRKCGVSYGRDSNNHDNVRGE